MTGGRAPQSLGHRGEELAAGHLRRRGYRILETNARSRLGEIDIIAEAPGEGDRPLVFVEVKTRRGTAFGSPLEAVGPEKQRRLARLAEAWRQQHPDLAHRPCRLDVIGITIPRSGEPVIEHIEAAF